MLFASSACDEPRAQLAEGEEEEPEWLRGEPVETRAPRAEPVVLPAATPFVGDFRLSRRADSLQGGSELTFESDGRYRGQLLGPGSGRTAEGRLEPDMRLRLRDVASALLALDQDEYVDSNIRGGLRVT